MTTVLFVDDDVNILHGLRRMLRVMRDECTPLFASSGSEALKIFSEQAVDVLVTDLRMPEMDGVSLLQEVRVIYPDTVRIVLSGYADREISLRTVGLAHQFLAKPASSETLINALRRAFALRHLAGAPKLQKLVLRLHTLPSLPDLYYQIVSKLNSPNTTTRQIGEIIARDMAMTARVLQLVNSSFFGLANQVVDPVQATTLLGLETVRDLTLSLHVFSQFSRSILEELGLETLWDHSLTVAGFTKIILQDIGTNNRQREGAFVSGLLHDLGKLVLAQNIPDEYRKLIEIANDEGTALIELEEKYLGATHAQVGAYLLGLWGLDESVMATTAYHHHPDDYPGPYRLEVGAVHIANVLAHELAGKQPQAESQINFHWNTLNALGMSDRLSHWRDRCQQFLDKGIKYD